MIDQMVAITKHALVITSFVFAMMLVIEYVNVLSAGEWQNRLGKNQWGQYLLAAFLGATPGCLGAFIVVALYSHRVLSLGAVVAAMVATSGDEAFVMLAMIPREAIVLTGILFTVGILAGIGTDLLIRRERDDAGTCRFQTHDQDVCHCFPRGQILGQWRKLSIARGTLSLTLLLIIFALAVGELGPQAWNWKRFTLVGVAGVSLFIVSTVPEHFLEEHLWKHVVKQHLLKIFFWTFGALVVVNLVIDKFQLNDLIVENPWSVLSVSVLVGTIPSSGPHLIFVTLFQKGLIPFSILLASSIVQDGHGMLPLLGYSRKDFIIVKAINVVVGLFIGGLVLSIMH